MSKKRADYYTLDPFNINGHQYATFNFFDHKMKRMFSSVDVALNLEYVDDDTIRAYVSSR